MAARKQKIDINTADEEELVLIEGIDSERARRILDHREKNGPFESWDDVESVPGIGEAMLEKLQRQASLGDWEAGAGEDEAEIEAEELIEALVSIVQLDAEAAAAYDVAASMIEVDEVRQNLESFRDDHLRHVEELSQCIRVYGGRATKPSKPDESVLVRLTESMASLGILAIISSLIATEHLTNGTYELALELPLDKETRDIVKSGFDDEQRHLTALTELSEREWEEETAAV
jgi:competence protein ComEA